MGKTTILKKFSSDYLNFDDPQSTMDFDRQGNAILQNFKKTLALDEVQKYPPIFDLLKLNIDHLKKPGRFLVSGSVRFSSRKAIRESLTGNLQKSISKLADKAWASESHINHYLKTGGLPGICFRRDEAIQYRLFQTHLDTLLGRDIHLVKETSISPQKLLSLLVSIAKNQGVKVSLANYARSIGVSQPTVKTLFMALEALFLIKSFGHTHFIEDAGLSNFLLPQAPQISLWDRIRLLYYHFRVQAVTDFAGQVKFAPYSSRGGLFVPFLIEERSRKKLAVFVEDSDLPSNKNLLAATLIKKKFPEITSIILVEGNQAFETAKGILCLPWHWAF